MESLDQLEQQIQSAMLADRHGLDCRLRNIRQARRRGKPFDRNLARLQRELKKSLHRFQRRRERVPRVACDEHPPGDPAPAPADPFGENPAAEALLVRAWRASIIGIVFIPVLSHFYSMYLLIKASLEARTFSPAGTRRYYSALIINLFILALFSVVILA